VELQEVNAMLARKLISVVLSIGFIPALAQQTPNVSVPAKRIVIVYTEPHPVINQIVGGIKEEILATYPSAQIIERHANGDRSQYSSTVLDALRRQPDLLIPITTPMAQIAVEEARGRIPIVFAGVTDPIGSGVARSIDRPEIATGSSDLCPYQQLLEVVKTGMPHAKRLGVAYDPTDEPAVFGLNQLSKIAHDAGYDLQTKQVTSRDEIRTQVLALAQGVDAILISSDNLMMENPDLVAQAAAERHVPVFACDSASVSKGAVAGVSVSYTDVGRAAGRLAVAVLSGKQPGTLPVSVLATGEKSVNMKAACDAGVMLPQSFIASAATIYNKDYVCRTSSHISYGVLVGFGLSIGLVFLILYTIVLRQYRRPR
jgi:putative ABC transport system substrate-binding protein